MPPDPFQILGIPPGFDLDPKRIERAYLTRAATIHPDLVGDDDEAAARSAQLTQARQILDNPESRANLLLMHFGGPSKEQDKSLPAGFLMDVMELREAVELALESGDPDARAEQTRLALAERARYIATLRDLFAAAASGAKTPALLGQIRMQLNAWRYIERLIEQLDPAYDPARADFSASRGTSPQG